MVDATDVPPRYLPCCQRHQWQSCSFLEGHVVGHASQLLLVNTHELCIGACTNTQQMQEATQARKHLTKVSSDVEYLWESMTSMCMTYHTRGLQE